MSSSSGHDNKINPGADSRAGGAPDAPRDAAAGPAANGGAGKQVARRSYLQKMAHEIKTPLSAIVAASEIMRDEQLGPIGDDRYRRYAADIHDSAKLVLAVVDRMMAQRGREPAQQPLEFTEFDPIALLHATVSTMLPLAERSHVRLAVVEPSQKAPRLIADVLSVKQILINLITNSLKFTDKGGKVTATAEYDSAGAFLSS
jgi:two-component system cell cycle sensor histidine kinase PleC